MKFKFKVQGYQTDAANSIVKVFEGQPLLTSVIHRHDFGTLERDKQARFNFTDENVIDVSSENAFMNPDVKLSSIDLKRNINKVQSDNGIEKSIDVDKSIGCVSLDIEMETGTGKTYVYTKAIYELHKHYGWTKYIIVVPSIAIREGVKKSLEITTDHFMAIYGKKIRFFTYDSSNLHEIDDYTQNDGIQVMIINNQAFAADFDEEKSKKDDKKKGSKRIIFEKRDEFGSRRPIDVIASNHPIIILDEPQKLKGTVTQKVLREQFKALFSMNFSATHAEKHNLIYVLDALDAYNQKLVKKIEVKGFELSKIGGAGAYLYLEDILLDQNKPPRAKIEIEVKRAEGSPKREIHIFDLDHNDIFVESKGLQQYAGLKILDIDPRTDTVRLTKDITLRTGDAFGDVTEKELRRLQIRATILSHLEKEQDLFHKGIKCLSLFFLDKVSNYRIYDENGDQQLGEYGVIFEKEYEKIMAEQSYFFDEEYMNYLKRFSVHDIHEGYFSIDKKTKRDVESSSKKEGEAELAAYEKILRRKDVLLSMDEPIRFIFSHSALREGWDNPNIFQICALKHTEDTPDKNNLKRQEVGRGLRLCVNQNGDRMDLESVKEKVHDINMLTVIANEGYKTFVGGLQDATREALSSRPRVIDQKFFEGKKIMVESGEFFIDSGESRAIYKYLLKNDLIDDDDWFDVQKIDQIKQGILPQMDGIEPTHHEGVKNLLMSLACGATVESMYTDGRKTKIRDNSLNENFKEFQGIWKQLQSKYAYYVEFDSDELIGHAIKAINDELTVSSIYYTMEVGRQSDTIDRDKFESTGGFDASKTSTKELKGVMSSDVKYDLIGDISKGCKLRRRTVGNILKGIDDRKFDLFKVNPEEFIRNVTRLINEQKASIIVEHIRYKRTDEDPYDNDIFTMSRPVVEFENAFKAKKHISDYVFTDGIAEKSIERKFAEALDGADEVCVYAKLPRGFSIPTPVGNYSPDWAIVFNENKDIRHIYFVAETKGSMKSTQLREVEKAKIHCADYLFNVLKESDIRYGKADTYATLLDVIKNTE